MMIIIVTAVDNKNSDFTNISFYNAILMTIKL